MPYMTTTTDYLKIARHYEECLRKHGPNHKGMDWPNQADLARRFDVMLGLTKPGTEVSRLLDLGCGAGLFAEHLSEHDHIAAFNYTGVDISPEMVAAAKEKNPGVFFETRDVLIRPYEKDSFDYVVMNGLLTEKLTLSQSDMEEFAFAMIKRAFDSCRVGIAFNVMSSHVDWKREDLFHLSFDSLASFLSSEVSRHFTFRADYGLYEYTAYVYRHPN